METSAIINRGNIPMPPSKTCEACGNHILFNRRTDEFARFWESLAPNKWESYWTEIPHVECQEALRQRRLDEERERAENEERARVEALEAARLQWVKDYYETTPYLPRGAKQRTFESYTPSDHDTEPLKLIRAWQVGDEFGFLLMGPAGSGKTHLLLALLNQILEVPEVGNQRQRVVWFPTSLGLDEVRSEVSSANYGLKDKALDANYLFIDDLGVENSTDWAREQLYQILDYRLSQCLPTFISTNLTPDELKSRYHERFVSRIKEMCVVVQLKGTDRRTDKMKQHLKTLKERAAR